MRLFTIAPDAWGTGAVIGSAAVLGLATAWVAVAAGQAFSAGGMKAEFQEVPPQGDKERRPGQGHEVQPP